MDYVAKLIEISITKKAGWQHSDCPVVRTSTLETGKAWKSVISEVPESPEELYKKCVLAIEAQSRYRREAREANQHVAQPKMLSAWLRAGRWEETIESHADLKQKIESQKCKCGQEVIGPKFNHCYDCLPHENIYLPEKTEYMTKSGLLKQAGETNQEWISRCRKHAIESIRRIL